jgi:CheY-like chemotaxis protein
MRTVRAANTAKLVVVIDDDAAVRRATEGVLRSQGFEVVAAESYSEAMDRLSKLGRRADLVVCGPITVE